jgi:2-iminobutanoate/2-iminopropanoate deaminase
MQAISTDKAPAAVGPYSQAVATGGLLFVSGQLPINPATGELPDDMLEQMRLCLENIEAIAIAAGTSLSKTVKTTVLVTDLSRFSEFNEVYGKAFTAALSGPGLLRSIGLASRREGGDRGRHRARLSTPTLG